MNLSKLCIRSHCVRTAALLCAVTVLWQHNADAGLVTGTFRFERNRGGVDRPVPAQGYDLTVSTAKADFTFNLKITSAVGTPTWQRGNRGLGVVSAVGPNSTINAAGEDLSFVLSVSVSNINPLFSNLTVSDLTFTRVMLRSASNRRDSGSFGNFLNKTGPGNPDSPSAYLWQNGRTGPDFPGMTPHRSRPEFNVRLMNGAPVASFTHTYVGGAYSFRRVGVAVISNPEPSGGMLGMLAAGILLPVACRRVTKSD